MAKSTQSQGPSGDPLKTLLGYQIRRLSVMVMADASEVLAPLELSPVDASVLLCIGARAGVTQSAVGRSLGIQRANMTPLVGALIERDLVARIPVDGRSQALFLTKSGNSLCRRARVALEKHENRLFASLAAAERQELTTMLRELWRSLS